MTGTLFPFLHHKIVNDSTLLASGGDVMQGPRRLLPAPPFLPVQVAATIRCYMHASVLLGDQTRPTILLLMGSGCWVPLIKSV